MTTIVYHHASRTIAADGRETDHNGFICCDHVTKIYHTPSGDVIAAAGPSSAIEYAVKHWEDRDLFESNTDLLGLLMNSDSHHMAAIVYLKEFDAFYEYHLTVEEDDDMPNPVNVYLIEINYSYSVGSGAPFAIAAMDFSRDAVGAVAYAMQRDSNTGGRIEQWSPNSALKEPVEGTTLPDHVG